MHSIECRGGGFGPKPENRADGLGFMCAGRNGQWVQWRGLVGCGGGGASQLLAGAAGLGQSLKTEPMELGFGCASWNGQRGQWRGLVGCGK